jgi:hypothetical protein
MNAQITYRDEPDARGTQNETPNFQEIPVKSGGYPLRNVQLRQGEQVVQRHDGKPKPEPPKDPNLKKWSAHLIWAIRARLPRMRSCPRPRCGAERRPPRRNRRYWELETEA